MSTRASSARGSGPRSGPGGLSALTIGPRSFGPATPDAVGPVADLLRRCRDLGVTTFDLSGARDGRFAAICLARAFPRPEPDLVALVPTSFGSMPPPRRDGGSAIPRGGVSKPPPATPPEEIVSLLSGFRRVVEARYEPRSAAGFEAFVSDLLRWREEAGVVDVCVRCATREEVERAMAHEGRPLVSASLSLLDPSLLGRAGVGWEMQGARCIARDVFAGGRLDGSAWSSVELVRPQTAGPPPSLRDLAAGFAGVVRLGFLTERRDRTLAQAALSFVLAKPWVLTACLPLPPPDRLEEILRFQAVPGLTSAELARLDQLEGEGGPDGLPDGS